MEYRRDANGVLYDRLVDDHVITLQAQDVKSERTGTHATVTIRLDGTILHWGYFNIDRDEDRVRAANAAYKLLVKQCTNGLVDVYPQDVFKHELDIYCRGLKDAWDGDVQAEMMEGSAERTEQRFTIFPYVLHNAGTILFAPPGAGKTYTMLTLAVSVDAGLTSLFPVTQGKVLFINLERSASSLRDRLGNVNEALDLPRTRPLLTLNKRGWGLKVLMPVVHRICQEHNVTCVMLDSISRAGVGDLTENKSVNDIIDMLNSLDREWVALAHTPRADSSHIFGSVFFEAGADVMVALNSQQQDDHLGVSLQITKGNDVGDRKQRIYAYDFDQQLGLLNIRPAQPGEFPDLEAGRTTLIDQVVDFLLGADTQDATATQVADALHKNRSHISRLLNDTPMRFVRTRKVGRETFFGVAS